MVIFIELQVHNIFFPGGQVPYLSPSMSFHVYISQNNTIFLYKIL